MVFDGPCTRMCLYTAVQCVRSAWCCPEKLLLRAFRVHSPLVLEKLQGPPRDAEHHSSKLRSPLRAPSLSRIFFSCILTSLQIKKKSPHFANEKNIILRAPKSAASCEGVRFSQRCRKPHSLLLIHPFPAAQFLGFQNCNIKIESPPKNDWNYEKIEW